MRFNPHPYQRRAISWVLDHPRCCLFLDMGLGKTVVSLSAVAELIDRCEVTKALVVAPKKVAESTWSDEAARWDHTARLTVARVLGDAQQRTEALKADADVYVVGRDSFVWLLGQYKGALPFDMIIIDELSSFKSPKSQRFKAMRIATAKVSRMVGLTGTPAPNGLIDLWAQMYCIDMGARLGKFVTRYRQTYFDEHRWNNIVVRATPRKGAEKAIRDKIADICLTMQAADYLTLPPLLVEDARVALPPKLAEGYRQFERERVMDFAKEHEGENATVMAASAASLMNKLSQYASGAIYDDDHTWHEIHREKTARLEEIVEASAGGVLVFYQYQHEAERIMRDLDTYKPRKYTGADDLTAWNTGTVRVLLAHPAATAYGLNMQAGGHTVVWYGTGWNLEQYQQANARLHRQGQSHPVTVVRLITTGTVDEKATAALDGKKSMQQALLDGLKAMIKEHGE